MVYGEMVSTNSTININVNGEMVKCYNGTMVQWLHGVMDTQCNVLMVKLQLLNGYMVRTQDNIQLTTKLTY